MLKNNNFNYNISTNYSKEKLDVVQNDYKVTHKYSKEWLSPSEIKKMINLPDINEKYEIWITMMYSCALRVSEAINVQYKDLNFEQGCIDIWGGKKRDPTELSRVPCDVHILKKIKRYCEHCDLKAYDFIMCSNKSNRVDRSHVYRVFNDICNRAGIDKKIGTHTLRRSRATHMLDNGVELVYVSKFLRHKHIATTMTYLDVSIKKIQDELERVHDNACEIVV